VPFGVQHRNYYIIVGCCGAYPLSYNSMMVLAKVGNLIVNKSGTADILRLYIIFYIATEFFNTAIKISLSLSG